MFYKVGVGAGKSILPGHNPRPGHNPCSAVLIFTANDSTSAQSSRKSLWVGGGGGGGGEGY